MNAALSLAEPFVPFFGAGNAAARTKTAAKPAEKGGFVPAVPSSATSPSPAPASSVPPAGPGPASPGASGPAPTAAREPQPHAAHGKPVVTLQRDGDKVTRIRVQCGCGETIDLDCVY